MHEIFCPSYDLKAGKKCTVRARLRAGGERLSKGLATPRLRTGCVVFACHRTRGPLWAEWTIPRMCARDGWGCGGGMMHRQRPWLAMDLLRTRKDNSGCQTPA